MDLPAFLEISPELWTSGQPIPSDWPLLARNGVEVIVNLAAPGSTNFDMDEMSRVLEAGMQFVAVPVVWTAPKMEDYTMFAAVMDACKGRRVLVHCALNMRVASFVYLYRVLAMGENESTARRDMEKIWSPDAIWNAFIREILAG